MTLFAEVNGARVVEGRIVIPAYGPAYAAVTLDKEVTLPSTGCELVLADLKIKCAPWRAASFQGRTMAKLIAGANGWRKTLPAQGYKLPGGVKLSLVLREAASRIGETVSVGEDRVLGGHYSREVGPAVTHLNALCPRAWWIGVDGVTRTGTRAAGKVTASFSVVSFDGARGALTIATETPADIMPAKTIAAPTLGTMIPTISAVTHTISKSGIRTEIMVAA